MFTALPPRRFVAFALIAAVGCLLVLFEAPSQSDWAGDPQDTVLYLSAYSYGLAGGLTLLAQGLAGVELRRQLMSGVVLPSVGGLALVARVFMQEFFGSLLGLLLVLGFAMGRTAVLNGSAPRVSLALALLPITGLAVCAAIGFMVGCSTANVPAVLVSATVPYFSLLVAGQSNSPFASALPYIDQRWDPGRHASFVPLILFQSGWWIAALACLGVAALVVHGGTQSRPRRSGQFALALGAPAAVLSLTVPTVLTMDLSVAVPVAESRCTSVEGNQVCYWSSRGRLKPRYDEALRMLSRASAPLGMTWSYHEQGLPSSPGNASLELRAAQSNPEVYEIVQNMTQAAARALADPRCSAESDQSFVRYSVMGALMSHYIFGGDDTSSIPDGNIRSEVDALRVIHGAAGICAHERFPDS